MSLMPELMTHIDVCDQSQRVRPHNGTSQQVTKHGVATCRENTQTRRKLT